MPLIRATAKLLKRLHLPAKPPESEVADIAPLGEWYADIDCIDREPFVVMLKAATGVGLVLPGRAAELRNLHTHARDQLALLFAHYGIDGALADAELLAWTAPPHYAATRDPRPATAACWARCGDSRTRPGIVLPMVTAPCRWPRATNGRGCSAIRASSRPVSATATSTGGGRWIWPGRG